MVGDMSMLNGKPGTAAPAPGLIWAETGFAREHRNGDERREGGPAQMRIRIAVAASLFLLVVGISVPGETETVGRSKISTPGLEIWRIVEPEVRGRVKAYDEIQFKGGERVEIRAGGCVQTGGKGLTWKRYVDPQGPNSDRLYHGLIRLPGMDGLRRIREVIGTPQEIPRDRSGRLELGYEDDDYSDNGYWGKDDGTGGQCRGVENAWVEIVIIRQK